MIYPKFVTSKSSVRLNLYQILHLFTSRLNLSLFSNNYFSYYFVLFIQILLHCYMIYGVNDNNHLFTCEYWPYLLRLLTCQILLQFLSAAFLASGGLYSSIYGKACHPLYMLEWFTLQVGLCFLRVSSEIKSS